MNVINRKETTVKTCFLKAGDTVMICDKNGFFMDDPHLVCCIDAANKKAAPEFSSNGLYSDERAFYLVRLKNGAIVPMPHLSSFICKVNDAELTYTFSGNTTA